MNRLWGRAASYCSVLMLAAATASPAPAIEPGRAARISSTVTSDVRVHRGGGDWMNHRRDRRGAGRRGWGGFDNYGYYYAPGEWARSNNRAWESDSFNDWWHDDPSRSMPRWTQGNRRECRQQYWTSAGWTC
ncbi:hypothetical protein G7077_09295 [Sphingomonas piscis]|uniref:Uncharacterized protein n=1 Tax=Sphingomonas piscis TaxID=2714943 RepID=A0A6G7YQN2_9SPHN|nr:hypothetical protein [Sphingomonas piscis]QIK79058.1 hypothetical protein G7077_09295 [Sphingomonas piscis]